MSRWIVKHSVSFVVLVIVLIPCLLIVGYFAKNAIDTWNAQGQLNEILRTNHYQPDAITVRTKLKRQESGPFSGLVWYEMSFSNQKTVQQSRKYLKQAGQPTTGLTEANSPLVYHVTLTPPTKKHPQWNATMYQDKATDAKVNFTIDDLPTVSRQVLE